MERAQQLSCPVDWLVRAMHNRCLPNSDKLWPHTTEGEPLGEIEFTLAARPGSKARTVRQQLCACHVEGRTVEATCIVARGYGAPTGIKPIECRLLTNRIAVTAADVADLSDWYWARWEIEILFNVCKTGCTVEEQQLGTIERIERALVLHLVVAWRIGYLVHMDCTCPDLQAHLFFDPDEVPGAYLLNKLRPHQPSVTAVYWALAALVFTKQGPGPARRM